MKVVPLAGTSELAARIALLSHGWEGDLSRSTAAGLESLAFEVREAEESVLQALVGAAARLGLDVVTGNGWALLAGPRARLSALARPWTAPEPLGELALALGHALPADRPALWQTARGALPLDRPVILGILNLTPDSFSDGGRFADPAAAAAWAEELLAEGAAVLDLGAESTRPGAAPVPEAEELARLLPALEAVVARLPQAIISVDTSKARVALAALEAGAAIVNDVSALRLDPAMAGLCAERGAGLVLMHSRGGAGELASDRHARFPGGVLPEVIAELSASVAAARRAGIATERMVVDPGLGFGKTAEQSIELLRGAGALGVLGLPILLGPSRKRFLGALTGRDVAERDAATAAACAIGWEAGASLFRVHAPGPVRDALAVAEAVAPR